MVIREGNFSNLHYSILEGKLIDDKTFRIPAAFETVGFYYGK